jgi:hypothetical protein
MISDEFYEYYEDFLERTYDYVECIALIKSTGAPFL